MWDIGVLTADFSISFFLLAPECCWDMGLSRLSVFCDFPCIDTHFCFVALSIPNEATAEPRLSPILILSSSHSRSLLSPFYLCSMSI